MNFSALAGDFVGVRRTETTAVRGHDPAGAGHDLVYQSASQSALFVPVASEVDEGLGFSLGGRFNPPPDSRSMLNATTTNAMQTLTRRVAKLW